MQSQAIANRTTLLSRSLIAEVYRLPGLVASNFEVDPLIVGPGGALVNIVRVSPGKLAKFYLLNVLPIRTETWKSGVYIFCVAVKRASDQGQTLATVLMD